MKSKLSIQSSIRIRRFDSLRTRRPGSAPGSSGPGQPDAAPALKLTAATAPTDSGLPMRRSFRTPCIPTPNTGVSPPAGIGVGMAVAGHPSLRTGRADFPHPALQSVSHPLVAGLVRLARAKAYREISPSFSKNALG